MLTINIGNIFSLFIFPSDFWRCKIDANSSYLRFCLDHHHLRRPPEPHSVVANGSARTPPSSLAARTTKTNSFLLVHLRTSSSREPLDVLDIGCFTPSGDLYPNASSFLAQQHAWRPPEFESCCGLRILDDYTTVLTNSVSISSTWSSSPSTFTAIFPHRLTDLTCRAVLHWTQNPNMMPLRTQYATNVTY